MEEAEPGRPSRRDEEEADPAQPPTRRNSMRFLNRHLEPWSIFDPVIQTWRRDGLGGSGFLVLGVEFFST